MTSRTPTDDGRCGEALDDITVRDHREANRFEAVVDGQVAFMTYERRPDAIVFVHTEVPESLRRRGIGTQLVKTGIAAARAEGLRLVAQCPFVRAYLRRHEASSHSSSRAGGPSWKK